jgi:threonyl-tRNA synthetase
VADTQIAPGAPTDPLDKLRHSAAHVLADAVQRVWPDAKITIGPPIENGFYYDFATDHAFTDEDLRKLEGLMADIIKANHPFVEKEVTRQEAIDYWKKRNEPYKLELIEGIPEGQRITLHSHGEFTDLCRGGHCHSTGDIKAFRLTHVAGAYWRGDSRNAQLQRIYGTAFFDQASLDEYLKRVEEAEKRDHRKLGKELGLLAFHPYAPGAAFWLPKGATVYHLLQGAMRRLLTTEGGYSEVRTPMLFKSKLWETSGHWQHYRDDMFTLEAEGEHYGLKPMNCPSHMLMFGMGLHSYRDLPIRLHDQGVLHRNELSGALSGLTRVRQFCQDDAHIFLRNDQIEDEITGLLKLVRKVYETFELGLKIKLSTRPEKFLGEIDTWNAAEASLEKALKNNQIDYKIEAGSGAFYGPKIDFDVTDALGRKWQTATIQLDYQIPDRFDLNYIGEDGAKHRPVVIHRAIFGSFERFIALLIEHYAGAFPLWLAPEQARVVVVSEKQAEFASKAHKELVAHGLRVDIDLSNDKLGAKIRRAQVEKVPYMLVIGDKEVQAGTVSARRRDGKQMDPETVEAFGKRLAEEGKAPF